MNVLNLQTQQALEKEGLLLTQIKQSKRDESQNSTKLHLDKYYTSDKTAQYCINKTYGVLSQTNEIITEVIEPSAGNGIFSYKIENCIAYDIEPDCENDSIIQQDFLTLELQYKKGRLFIGNPPFGSRNNLAMKFCNKCFEYGDYVAFILPISQLNNTQSIYKFDLIHSENLGKIKYSDKIIHCCFNIYKRPESGKYNTLRQFWKLGKLGKALKIKILNEINLFLDLIMI